MTTLSTNLDPTVFEHASGEPLDLETFCCHAIVRVLHGPGNSCLHYVCPYCAYFHGLFKPGSRVGTSNRAYFSCTPRGVPLENDELAHEHRRIALCLAAAILRDEQKSAVRKSKRSAGRKHP